MGLPSRDSASSHYDCIRRRPDLLFCCFIEVTMTVVKSVSDGLRDCESETQLNLNRPLRISSGPRHLRRPLAAISTYANRPASELSSGYEDQTAEGYKVMCTEVASSRDGSGCCVRAIYCRCPIQNSDFWTKLFMHLETATCKRILRWEVTLAPAGTVTVVVAVSVAARTAAESSG